MNKDYYDPVERAGSIETVVYRDDLRKYYRFRPARFYGPSQPLIASAAAFVASFAGHGTI